MEVNTEKKSVPRISKTKLMVILSIFFAVVLVLPVAGYNWLQKEVQVNVDGESLKLKTFSGTVEELLAEKSIKLRKEDEVIPKKTTELKDDMVIEVERAFPVNLLVEGKKIELYTTEATVEELLKVAKVKLQDSDKTEPDLKATVKPGIQVRVVRVTEKLETKEIAIDYKTEKKADNSMTEGQRKVTQQGQEGINQQVIKVIYEDGSEVKREILEQKVVKEPINHVIAYGTKPKVLTVTRGGQNLTYSKELVMTATAYTHTGHRTSTGKWPGRGTIAVDPRIIPYGTRLYVDGYGYGVAADKGGAIVGNKIDVFMDSLSEANRWGRRNVKVYILK